MALWSLSDGLFCQEESLELEEEPMWPMPSVMEGLEAGCRLFQVAPVGDEEWAEVLCSLVVKEAKACPELPPPAPGGEQGYLLSARRESVECVVHAAARHAFSAVTALLAVNYLDRCFFPSAGYGGLRLQRDKPWMGRLAAVACLSLAAKVEETAVPSLLDLQVLPAADNKHVFDDKTIQRMELLMLSALGWRMNPVTPLSFIHHLLARCSKDTNPISFPTDAAAILELLSACEATLVSVVSDWRWIKYPASAWAAAALLHAAAFSSLASHEVDHLISFLEVPKGNLEECNQLINESICSGGIIGHKRKHFSSSYYSYSPSQSPKGVLGSCFSCESSSSATSSPEICLSKRPSCSANGGASDL